MTWIDIVGSFSSLVFVVSFFISSSMRFELFICALVSKGDAEKEETTRSISTQGGERMDCLAFMATIPMNFYNRQKFCKMVWIFDTISEKQSVKMSLCVRSCVCAKVSAMQRKSTQGDPAHEKGARWLVKTDQITQKLKKLFAFEWLRASFNHDWFDKLSPERTEFLGGLFSSN